MGFGNLWNQIHTIYGFQLRILQFRFGYWVLNQHSVILVSYYWEVWIQFWSVFRAETQTLNCWDLGSNLKKILGFKPRISNPKTAIFWVTWTGPWLRSFTGKVNYWVGFFTILVTIWIKNLWKQTGLPFQKRHQLKVP